MSFTVKGFESANKELNKLIDNFDRVKEKYDEQLVGFDQLFHASFMQEHTEFSDFDSWISAGGFVFESQEEFDALDEKLLDNYVALSTDFDTWQDMLDEAGALMLTSELGW